MRRCDSSSRVTGSFFEYMNLKSTCWRLATYISVRIHVKVHFYHTRSNPNAHALRRYVVLTWMRDKREAV